MSLRLFDPLNVDEQAFMLAAQMPVGKVWESAFDPTSNMGLLIRGLGVEFYRLEVLTQQISNEVDINQANELLVEWEKSVGLPDSCFSTDVPIEERREQILQKFSNFGGVQMAEDFIRVGAVFGFTIRIITGLEPGGFPMEFPVTFFEDTKAAVHTIFVRIIQAVGDVSFPLPFPIPFSFGGKQFLQCIFDKLAPANTQVIIQ